MALGLALCDGKVTFYPTGKKGPDLLVINNNSRFFVEVTRVRDNETLKQQLKLAVGGGIKEIHGKIVQKVKQLQKGEINIVVLYSSREIIEDVNFVVTTERYLTKETTSGLHKTVSGILFASRWKKLGNIGPQCSDYTYNAKESFGYRAGCTSHR